MITTKKFKILGMHCASCAMSIDGKLEDTEGVKSALTNYAKSEVEIEYDSSKINEEKIIKTIKSAGYLASPLD
ncbi:cation transporter [Patescibacteria group bacterium]|nr:cation transporter [Patescibacteria group bacterium]